MRQTYMHSLVNGSFEDPALYVRFMDKKGAYLLDCGDVRRLNATEINKISRIFITHTHIDHFIGFDHILRVLLRREEPLKIYGPQDIIMRIEGKLKGYNWNLIRNYPLKIEAYAIGRDKTESAGFHAEQGLNIHCIGSSDFSGIVCNDGHIKVIAETLTHDIDCLAYSIEEDFHINIDKSKLDSMGLSVGKWLKALKDSIRVNAPLDTVFHLDEGDFELGRLINLTSISKGQKITYITDSSPTYENIQKIIKLADGSDTLYCEACFSEVHKSLATERNHLTASMAGSIARQTGSKRLVIMHFSPRYADDPSVLIDEASEAFGQRAETA